MVETYKKIEGFENYSVSDFGNVRNDKTGTILKGKNTDGYLQVVLMQNKVKHSKRLHKLVAQAFLLNPQNKPFIDHIDNNRRNNNLKNLRFATSQENNQNRSMSSKNTSGTKGVCWHKGQKRWLAKICINGKVIHLGYFINKDDAINIRVQSAKDAFGEFINKCELIINV
jgi:hypothetical protein